MDFWASRYDFQTRKKFEQNPPPQQETFLGTSVSLQAD